MGSVLWVTDEVPDHDGPGGSTRQAHCLAATAARVPVHVLLAADRPPPAAGDLDGVTLVGGVDGRPAPSRLGLLAHALAGRLPLEIRRAAPVRERLAAALRQAPEPDTVVVQHAWLAPLVAERDGAQRWVLDLHNLPSVRAGHALANAGTRRRRWLLRRERARARRLEARAVAAYDTVVVASPADAGALPGRPAVVGNGVDPDRYHPAPLPANPRVVFTGHLGYAPNIDGVCWFVDAVWPRIRAARPDAALAVVGYDPGPEVRRLADNPGVAVHADVPSVLPHLHAARVAVVPLRVGSGTRLKALEALAAGRPVVGTSVGLEGLGLRDGETAAVADDPAGMAGAVLGLLAEDGPAARLAEAGRAHVTARFAWPRLGARFAAAALGETTPPPSTLR